MVSAKFYMPVADASRILIMREGGACVVEEDHAQNGFSERSMRAQELIGGILIERYGGWGRRGGRGAGGGGGAKGFIPRLMLLGIWRFAGEVSPPPPFIWKLVWGY